jgi:hypothetical protein
MEDTNALQDRLSGGIALAAVVGMFFGACAGLARLGFPSSPILPWDTAVEYAWKWACFNSSVAGGFLAALTFAACAIAVWGWLSRRSLLASYMAVVSAVALLSVMSFGTYTWVAALAAD